MKTLVYMLEIGDQHDSPFVQSFYESFKQAERSLLKAKGWSFYHNFVFFNNTRLRNDKQIAYLPRKSFCLTDKVNIRQSIHYQKTTSSYDKYLKCQKDHKLWASITEFVVIGERGL